MRDLVEKQYQRVGFTEHRSEVIPMRFHRTNMIRWACNVDNEDCLANAARLFDSWMKKSDPDSDNP